MSEARNDGISHSGDLLQRLKAVRESTRQSNESQRRGALREALAFGLASLPPKEREGALDGVRDALVDEAVRREQRIVEHARDAEKWKAECVSLRAENEVLRKRVSQGEASSSGEVGHSAAGIRHAVLAMVEGAPPQSPPADPDEASIIGLAGVLLDFALRCEMSVEGLKMGLGIRPDQSLTDYQLTVEVRTRIAAYLRDQPGSLELLKKKLYENADFCARLSSAYQKSAKRGIQSLLRSLDPQPLKESRQGKFGVRWDDLWRDVVQLYTGIAETPTESLYEEHCLDALKSAMRGDGGGSSYPRT